MKEAQYYTITGQLLQLPHIQVNEEGEVQFQNRVSRTWKTVSFRRIKHSKRKDETVVLKKSNGKVKSYGYGRLIYHTFNDCSDTYNYNVYHLNGDISDSRLCNLSLNYPDDYYDDYGWMKHIQIVA